MTADEVREYKQIKYFSLYAYTYVSSKGSK